MSRANEGIEEELTGKDFSRLEPEAHSKISKYRYVIDDGDFKWEIDCFENINLIIGEIEIVTDDEHLDSIINQINSFPLPSFITDNLIMEVSDFKPFSNKKLAITYEK